jgi:hypothetical protein
MVANGVPETLKGSLSWQQAVVFQWPSRQALLTIGIPMNMPKSSSSGKGHLNGKL